MLFERYKEKKRLMKSECLVIKSSRHLDNNVFFYYL